MPDAAFQKFLRTRVLSRGVAFWMGLAMATVALLLLLWPEPKSAQTPRQRGVPPVLTETLASEPFVEVLEALGTVFANEQALLKSRVTERVREILFSEGQSVRRGDLLLQMHDGEQQAELAEALALLEERHRQWERVRSIQESGAVAKAVLDEEQSRYEVARARAELARVRVAERRMEAPFDGVLGLRQVSPGQLVSPDSPLVTLSDLASVKVDFSVPERYVGRLQAGLVVRAESVAYPGATFEGQIGVVSPVVDGRTRSVSVRALFENPDHRLRPGMLLRLRMEMASRESLLVPESALISQGTAVFVYCVDADSVARRVRVETGRREKGRVEVVAGLSAGDVVVTHGFRVHEGQPVRVLPADAVFQTAPAP